MTKREEKVGKRREEGEMKKSEEMGVKREMAR